ncbi:aldo/keto reductase [Nocardioides endophyticus]|uniref:Aldo/keto reductase n=1 Tax=Nocardioides endophyticus TaxID=1353775 RepID=A0ABP8ZEP6_9ACTN
MDLEMGLVLGTMYFGTRTDEATSYALLDRFVEAGGRVLDTANCYSFWTSPTGHGGQSEMLLGRWLAANPGLREELVIATKVGVEPTDDGGIEGLSAPVIERESARSLERLGIDAIDVYWAHGEDRATDLEETVAAFGALVERGVVRRLGVSNHPTWRVERARGIAERLGVEPWTALQLTTSYVEPRPGAQVPGKDHRFGFVGDETVDYLELHPEMELWVYSPLIQGSFDRADRPFPEAYDHPGTTARLATLNALAGRLGVPASQVVLGWMLAKGWKPIVGVSSVEQLDSALESRQLRSVQLTADLLGADSLP